MKSAEELKKVYKVSQEGTVIHVVFFKHLAEPEDHVSLAHLIDTDMKAILSKNPNTFFDVLVNLVPLESWPDNLPNAARMTYLSMSRLKGIRKSAIVGDHNVLNFQTKFILWLISMNKNIQWFSNIETAEDWFHQ